MKRQRTVSTRSKRPIEKKIITVNKLVGVAQQQTAVFNANEAVTYAGGHLQISWDGNPAAIGRAVWAVVLIREGQTASTISLTDNTATYLPEQDVLAMGVFQSATLTDLLGDTVTIKTKRKLKQGDAIYFIVLGSIASVGNIFCTATSFVKQ